METAISHLVPPVLSWCLAHGTSPKLTEWLLLSAHDR